MRRPAVSRAIPILLLLAVLVLMSIVHAGSWSSPSYMTEPNFCGGEISGEHPLSISGDGSRIVFQRSEYINASEYQFAESGPPPLRPQVFVVNSDGTGLTQLADDSEGVFMFPCISDNGEKIAFWNALWCDPESEVNESEVGISLVSYLSDVEDEKDAESTFPAEIVIGGIVAGFALCIVAFIYLKRKERYKMLTLQ